VPAEIRGDSIGAFFQPYLLDTHVRETRDEEVERALHATGEQAAAHDTRRSWLIK
jgi:hypothetical protein